MVTREEVKAPPTGNVVLYGDCNVITAAAVLFGIMDWQVTVVADAASLPALRSRFAGFQVGPAIKLEALDAQTDGAIDYRVHCLAGGAPASLPRQRDGATVIELAGVNHAD